jgi:uncharacterized protein
MTVTRPTQCLLLMLTLLPTVPAFAAGPGFDCTKATRQIDKAICAWDTVGSLDGRMAATFKATLAAQKDDAAVASVRAGQKAWLAERRSEDAGRRILHFLSRGLLRLRRHDDARTGYTRQVMRARTSFCGRSTT